MKLLSEFFTKKQRERLNTQIDQDFAKMDADEKKRKSSSAYKQHMKDFKAEVKAQAKERERINKLRNEIKANNKEKPFNIKNRLQNRNKLKSHIKKAQEERLERQRKYKNFLYQQ